MILFFVCFDERSCRNIPDDANDITTETSSVEGLDSVVIQTFPVFVYRDVKNLQKSYDIKGTVLKCVVCLSEFRDEDMLRLLPCHHAFHPHCIGTWFVSSSTCPVCRSDLKTLNKVTGTAPLNASDVVISLYEDDENHSEATSMVVSETEHEGISLVRNSEHVTDGINPDSEMNFVNASENRTRYISQPIGKLLRSYTTGHSLIQENGERYTLRLPDDARKDILSGKLNCRSASGGSSHCGCNGSCCEGSSNRGRNYMTFVSERWAMAPQSVARSSSTV
ncbi:hypothetical protein MKW94_025510 [Papaver nudicaule]|uniref:RING-type E3 ubiquitin transferase n=1 Tax=Papaver nudicaule TaxID=74823 RepID=A0AA41UZJ7_PAPNU|nr:hypothetical protein [Papaver nudicaule]